LLKFWGEKLTDPGLEDRTVAPAAKTGEWCESPTEKVPKVRKNWITYLRIPVAIEQNHHIWKKGDRSWRESGKI
jgi:hypothetical protein